MISGDAIAFLCREPGNFDLAVGLQIFLRGASDRARRSDVRCLAFDLLYLNGHDLRGLLGWLPSPPTLSGSRVVQLPGVLCGEMKKPIAYNEVGLRHYHRILLPPGTSAVEVGMLPQRQALAGLGYAGRERRSTLANCVKYSHIVLLVADR